MRKQETDTLPIQRSLLPKTTHPTVDSVLKDLKICTRRLQATMNLLQTEYQLLERLYYKGNNQHRSALFWRRIVEMRRYGNRLARLDISSTMDCFRSSFWGDTTAKQSVYKGAWTHIPSSKMTKDALQKTKICATLLDSMNQSLVRTYEQLHLNMQTGAFLQLILTLSAITSRISALVLELRPILNDFLSLCCRTLDVVNAPTASSPEAPQSLDNISTAVISEGRVDEDQPIRDLTATPALPNGRLGSPDHVVTCETNDLGFNVKNSTTAESTAGIKAQKESLPPKKMLKKDAAGKDVIKSKQKARSSGKSKKKKRDEIDDIFGF
ncbi:hypothetical protein C8Q75DRAFT_740568 [Abortiporus biennis]|nr:hypothetical protein C8Q75DRAFT_740568 [Abortiporus biennis]